MCLNTYGKGTNSSLDDPYSGTIEKWGIDFIAPFFSCVTHGNNFTEMLVVKKLALKPFRIDTSFTVESLSG